MDSSGFGKSFENVSCMFLPALCKNGGIHFETFLIPPMKTQKDRRGAGHPAGQISLQKIPASGGPDSDDAIYKTT